jgi:hypothetical protein
MSTSYLDLHLEIYSEGRLRTKFYDNRDGSNIPIVNFRFKRSTFPAAAYGLYISQMIRYSWWRQSHFRSDDSIVTKWNHCFNSIRVSSILYQGHPGRSHKLWNIGVATRLTRRVPLVEQDLDPSEAPEITTVFSGTRVTRPLALYISFVDRCFSFPVVLI